jgi:hypothetical protein
MSPETFSSLVSQAMQIPEVRHELVDAYKARIQSGQYPGTAAVEGLIRLMGGTWVQQANSPAGTLFPAPSTPTKRFSEW